MIKEIKNTKKQIKYLVSTNLRDIIVLVREKVGIEYVDKMKMKFRIVDEYEQINDDDGNIGYIKTIIENNEEIRLYTLDDYNLENMLDLVNSKYKEERLIEEFINSSLKDAKTIEFIDDEEDKIDKEDDDIIDMK
jgi:hypothetical protein